MYVCIINIIYIFMPLCTSVHSVKLAYDVFVIITFIVVACHLLYASQCLLAELDRKRKLKFNVIKLFTCHGYRFSLLLFATFSVASFSSFFLSRIVMALRFVFCFVAFIR